MLLLNDLGLRIAQNRLKIEESVNRVLTRGWLVLGPEVDLFEKSFAEYLGAKHCVSVANGTDAIELALKSLGVHQGDLVATVANAGFYTTTALLGIGAEPIYMDVDVDSKNVNLEEVRRAVDIGAKVVVVTHLYGLAVKEIEAIAALCREKNVKLFEDCAQAHGARVNGKCVGTFGDASSFSFYPTKNLGAIGDGGAVVTNHCEVAESVKQLRQYGWSSKYRVEVTGARNSRLDEMQAAILSGFLPCLDDHNTRRRNIATEYSKKIRNPKLKVPDVYGEEYVAHLYVVCATDRNALQANLSSHKISTAIHYPILDYQQPMFADLYKSFSLTNSEKLLASILTLPLYPEMSDLDIAEVIAQVNAW